MGYLQTAKNIVESAKRSEDIATINRGTKESKGKVQKQICQKNIC